DPCLFKAAMPAIGRNAGLGSFFPDAFTSSSRINKHPCPSRPPLRYGAAPLSGGFASAPAVRPPLSQQSTDSPLAGSQVRAAVCPETTNEERPIWLDHHANPRARGRIFTPRSPT